MNITSITIQNYRSIEKETILPSQFNIFVGQNNHGKTNIFEAVEWFFNKRKGEVLQDLRHGREGKADVVVEIEFTGAQEGIAKMKNETAKTKISKLVGKSDVVTVKRIANDSENKRVLIIDGEEKDPGTGFDNALNDFLPKFEYVDTKKYYEELVKFGRTATPISTMLSGVLEALLETNDQYKEFRKKFEELFSSEKSEIRVQLNTLSSKVKVYLSRQFPDCVEVEFTVGEPSFDELLKNFDISIHDGIVTTAEEKGDGMQRALMLAIIQTYADYRREHEDTGKTFLFFIDEAELHLHPTAQRNLKNALHQLSEQGDQVLINTHSSVFVADDLPNQTIFRVEKIDNKTSAKPVSDTEKPEVVYELLGGSPADLLLPKNFMIVEGQSESEFLKMIIKRFYPEKPPIKIIFARGDLEREARSMDIINAIYVPLGVTSSIYKDHLVILCDKPSSTKKETSKNTFLGMYPHLTTNNQYFELPVNALEKYYPNPWEKSDAEIDALEKAHGKVPYARDTVGANITQEQFENDMPVVFSALTQSWALAY